MDWVITEIALHPFDTVHSHHRYRQHSPLTQTDNYDDKTASSRLRVRLIYLHTGIAPIPLTTKID